MRHMRQDELISDARIYTELEVLEPRDGAIFIRCRSGSLCVERYLSRTFAAKLYCALGEALQASGEVCELRRKKRKHR
jgi:hypothetical protein